MNKIILLGLDGATWKVLNPLIENNYLPNFKKLVTEGTRGYLESTKPPITAPAWLSMATGKNPGKTGITKFVNFDPKDLTTYMATSEDYRKNGAIWDQLNRKGYKTYLIGYPMLYPYYDLDGVIVGGFHIPPKANLAHPQTIEERINEISNGYVNHVPWHSDKYENNKNMLMKDLSTMFDKQIRVVKNLLKDEWDFFAYVCSVPDFLQHAFWEDWENSDSPFHQKFIKLWELMDEKLSVLMGRKNTNLFVVSDHGFGPLKNKVSPMKWFIDQGYIRKKKFYYLKKIVHSFLKSLNKKMHDLSLYEKLNLSEEKIFRFIKTKSNKEPFNVSLPVPAVVDMENSKVIFHTSGIHGSINILMNSTKDVQQLKREIRGKIKELEKKFSFKIKIYDAEEIYQGPKADKLPDIIFNIDNYASRIDNEIVEDGIYKKNFDFGNRTGSHRDQGIFISHGPDIKSSEKMKKFRIYDIAPTILHLYDLPISNDIDGSVLKEIFKEGSEPYQREIRYSEEGEEEKIKDTIKDLKL